MTEVPRFPAFTRADWETRAQRELGTRPLASLTRTTAEGIAIGPLQVRDDVAGLALDGLPGQAPFTRGRTALGPGTRGRWRSVQEYRYADPAEANAAARADLDRGAHGCWFRLGLHGRGIGLIDRTPDDVDVLLQGIDPVRTPIWIDAGLHAPELIDALESWWDEHDLPEGESGAAGGGVVYDPWASWGTGDAAFMDLVDRVLGTRRGLLGISTVRYHDAGASDGEELALALASCVELMRRGQPLGLEPADIAATLIWTLAIGPEPFMTIAKFRAARLVWAKLAIACGISESGPPWIHAVPSQRTWTRRAPWNNTLRGTYGCFAAAIGGADSITTAAFDEFERGSELGRRLAINTQVILRDECSLDRVIDPAGGSFHVESLTDALARAAWSRFQAIEREGGLVAGLESGAIQAAIARTATDLQKRVATRKQPITGVSTWPTLDEPTLPSSAGSQGASEAAGLPIVRLAAPFEALRDAAEAFAREHGMRPRIFAATLGPLAHHQARLDFARNLFAAGGVELVEPAESSDRIAEFRASGCMLSVVCGRDEDYPAQVGPLLRGLFEAGAKRVWIAGRPPAQPWPDAPSEAKPDYVYLGCDVLQPLTRALQILGAIEGVG